MANKLYEENDIIAIADAIREKNGTDSTYKVSEMSTAISQLSVGDGITPSGNIEITENGTYDVKQYSEAVVNVQAEEGSGIVPSGTLEISKNGTYDVTNYAEATVIVAGCDNGLPSNILTGTFTVTEDTQESQIINHNAGVIPAGVLVVADEIANPNELKTKTVGGMKLERNEAIVFNNAGTLTYGSVTSISDVTETSFTINPRSESAYPFSSKLTYRWWVWV